jgi:anti-sigma factor RsiW
VEYDDQDLICRYLLGELPDRQQVEFEERYFADDELFERLLLVEDKLIDKYARGEFSGPERERIEKYFLKSQARRKRLMFVQALMRYMASLSEESSRQRRSWWGELKSLLHVKNKDTD